MNKIIFISLVLFLSFQYSLAAPNAYRDSSDQKISLSLIGLFKRECSHKIGVDQTKLVELQTVYEKVKKDSSPIGEKALACYQDKMGQLIGIQQLYKDLCEEVGKIAIDYSDQDVLRLLLMSQRYRHGITPLHDLLNDCLVEKNATQYLVKSLRGRSERLSLRNELESLNIQRPFEPSRVEFR